MSNGINSHEAVLKDNNELITSIYVQNPHKKTEQKRLGFCKKQSFYLEWIINVCYKLLVPQVGFHALQRYVER